MRIPAFVLVLLVAMGLAQPANAAGTWGELRRPLDLPKIASGQPCPISPVDESVDWESANIFGGSGIGPGPAYPGLGSDGGHFRTGGEQFRRGFYGGKLFWYVDSGYDGPVLIRGRRLDRSDSLRFNQVGSRELRIGLGNTVEWDGQPPGSRGVPSGVLIRSSGCYGVQIDGSGFSRTVVFSAYVPDNRAGSVFAPAHSIAKASATVSAKVSALAAYS